MISFDQALALIAAAARPLGREAVALEDAHGRTLAEPVRALVASPPRDVSTMDGYAVRDADLPGRLSVAGESLPGGADAALAPGTCRRIFTGGPVPAGADRIVIQENVTRDGDFALFGPPGAARHIRPRGSDFEIGDVLIEAGRRLDPRALVAAAGADCAELNVWRRPRVAILGTGDELAAPGTARATPGAIPDSLSIGLAALVGETGAEVVARRRLKDDLRAMEAAAAEALVGADLVVVTGGASVGDRDFAKAMFAPAGLDLIFAKVAIKPGKPVWFGRARGKLVIGLPGNPTSALVTARLLLVPLLAGLSGRAPTLDWRQAPLAADLAPPGDRETFARAVWDGGAVRVLSNQDSGAQKTLADAALLVRRPARAPAAQAGDPVAIIGF